MKNNLLANNIQKYYDSHLIVKTILKPDIIVKSGILELDRITNGFKARKITLIDGNCRLISDLPNQICVNTYRTFKSNTVYIDGGICADPYKIARYARIMELDQRKTLEHVQISRAFTVYQLSAVIQDMLESIIKKYNPRTLIIGMFPNLFLDSDISTQESQTLLKNNLDKIRVLTQKYNLITIFTNLDRTHLSNTRNMRKILYSNVDEIIRMKQLEHCINIDLVKRQKRTKIITFSKEQYSLEKFGMVIQ